MEIADIKKLLAQSKKEPVNCAVGVSKDGLGQILLHKTKPPRTLLKELEAGSSKLSTAAFGSAFVDVDVDPKLVILTLNKAPSGLAKRLKKSMAGTGFNKIEIRNEDGSVAEKDAGDEEAAAAAAAPAAPNPAPPADLQKTLGELIKRVPAASASTPAASADLKRLAGEAVAAVRGADPAAAAAAVTSLEDAIAKAEQGPAGAAPNAAPDFKAMQAELGQMIRDVQAVAASQPDRLDSLRTLAGGAAAAIKAADPAGAPAAMAALRDALAAGKQPAARPAAEAAPIIIWREAKETVDARIGDLRKSVLAHPDESLRPTLAQIADKGLNGVTDRASVGMMAAMMEAKAQPAKALKAIETFQTFLAGDIARGIDENPFKVAVGLRTTLGAALDSIRQHLAG